MFHFIYLFGAISWLLTIDKHKQMNFIALHYESHWKSLIGWHTGKRTGLSDAFQLITFAGDDDDNWNFPFTDRKIAGHSRRDNFTKGTKWNPMEPNGLTLTCFATISVISKPNKITNIIETLRSNKITKHNKIILKQNCCYLKDNNPMALEME